MPVKLLLVDDHLVIRDALQMIVNEQADMKVVAGVSDGESAVVTAEALRPDVVLMDISMPGTNGIEATRNILARLPDTKIIIITMHRHPEYANQAFLAGASGFLMKTTAGSELIEAIRTVAAGRRFVGKGVVASCGDTVPAS